MVKPASLGDKPKPMLHAGGGVAASSYFTVNIGCEAGINHLKSALGLLIKESLSLNRTPIVFTPRFLATHNFDKAVDASWGKYIDLSRIVITKDGATHYVEAVEEDAIVNRDALTVLEVKGKHLITPAENAAYRVIVKNNPSGLGLDAVYTHDEFDFNVEFLPSRAVRHHADQVWRRLGEYHAMHVRRGDMLAEKARCPNLAEDTRPEKILETLSRVLAKGARVYVLTDEQDRNYFEILKQDYQIFRYFDFPELKAFVEGDHPDNFFLYEIEKLIFANAHTKIHTFAHPKGETRISLTSDLGWS